VDLHLFYRKLGISSLAVAALFFLAPLARSVIAEQGQQSSQSQEQQKLPQTQDPSQPPAKAKKIWTSEEVEGLRTPADTFMMEKEAGAAKEAAAKAAAAKEVPKAKRDTPLEIKLPPTADETRKMIGDMEADIQEETEALARSNKELEGAPAEGKAQIQNDIDRLTASLELARRELKALQDHLQRLTVEPQEESTRVAPKPASF